MTISTQWKSKVLGQDGAIDKMVPFVKMFQAGIAPEGRPIGVFLLMGPTGVGKTETIEALAEVIHGDRKNVLRVDCGELQHSHEIAKLIGSPPGYLGHRESNPLLSQQRVNGMASDQSELSLICFDEIEKSSDALMNLLLGIFDKSTLTLGDNSRVNFDRTLIFMTSNLGVEQINNLTRTKLGFTSGSSAPADSKKMNEVGLAAAKKTFSAEFMNRIDEVLTYNRLTEENISQIFDLQMIRMQQNLLFKLGMKVISLSYEPAVKDLLLSNSVSYEYGARDLKRTITKMILHPLAAKIADHEIVGPASVRIKVKKNEIVFQEVAGKAA